MGVEIMITQAVLVGLVTHEQSEAKLSEYLDELEFLAKTLGIRSIKRFTQRLNCSNSVSFVGKGKLQEIKSFVENKNNKVDVVIFDDELSPKQIKNVETFLKIKIMDRTALILDIFAFRAKTAHSKKQVELAKCIYMLPRLSHLWTHLERQSGGGSGGFRMRGPGESQLETDRRIILNKIVRLKDDLKKINNQKVVQRYNRKQMVRVALVGYTNVGKSTLMNVLSKSSVFAENKLFATLDTTVRKVTIDSLVFLLTDTVGFVRKLPVELIKSFKSTLDEIREADLLIHIVDISHSSFKDQFKVVMQTLREINREEKPLITVFNKIDLFSTKFQSENYLIKKRIEDVLSGELNKICMSEFYKGYTFISAKTKQNILEFKQMLYDKIKKIYNQRFFLLHGCSNLI
jgi:GTP-binding protein HflX